ncbi:hypothetical protein GGI06_000965 [Coemansia sp. S85]|nr:hypothetical protein GGI06_000965 [Coemansia sp. S85]
MFVTSPESRAYRIDDFDGLEDARVRLPVLPQQPFTHASQDSLLSRIEPSNATAGTSETSGEFWPKRAGGLVRMVEAIEAFWRLQVKFPDGLSAERESSQLKTSECAIKIMDLALRLVGHPQPSATGKPYSYRRLYLEFLDHGRCTSLVNAMTVSGGIGVSTGCSAAPFELIYAVAANPTILYADHNFGCGSKARRSTNAGVAQSILLLVHSQSPGAGLKIDYPEFHKHIESNGDGGSDGGALRFNISEATELLTCVISYDPDQLPIDAAGSSILVDGNSRPIDIVSVYGTIAKRVIKQAVAFTSGSLGNSGPGKKRSKDHSDSAGLLAGRFDTRIVLHDDRDNESAVPASS